MIGGDLQGYGNSLDNVIVGTAGANLLDGRAGVDTMIGGAGNDLYYVDSGVDAAVENFNEGFDTVFSTDHLVLGANVENLTLIGGDLQGYGNSLDNVITGTDGANLLDGRGGNDQMIGGLGNDAYLVDVGTDAVIENFNEGLDIVFSTTNLVLADNVEYLRLMGSNDLQGYGNGLANILFGNDGANLLDGRGGADLLEGGRRRRHLPVCLRASQWRHRCGFCRQRRRSRGRLPIRGLRHGRARRFIPSIKRDTVAGSFRSR